MGVLSLSEASIQPRTDSQKVRRVTNKIRRNQGARCPVEGFNSEVDALEHALRGQSTKRFSENAQTILFPKYMSAAKPAYDLFAIVAHLIQ